MVSSIVVHEGKLDRTSPDFEVELETQDHRVVLDLEHPRVLIIDHEGRDDHTVQVADGKDINGSATGIRGSQIAIAELRTLSLALGNTTEKIKVRVAVR